MPMAIPHLGRFESRTVLLNYLETDFLLVKEGSRTKIYAAGKKAKFVHKLFNLLREVADRDSIQIEVREARLQMISDAVDLGDKELRQVVKALADSFDRWELKHFVARIGDEETEVSLSAAISVLDGTPHLDWNLNFKVLPDEAPEDAEFVQEHLIQYLAALQQRLKRERSGIGGGIYIPVDHVDDAKQEKVRRADSSVSSTSGPSRWRHVRNFVSVAVVATAGRGKTSLLISEAERLAKSAAQALKESAPLTSIRIPVFLRLNQLVAAAKFRGSDWLSPALREAGFLSAATAVASCMARRTLVLLLDGLDEVEWSHRDEVDALLSDLADMRIATIFTSRPEAFEIASPDVRKAYQAVTLPQFTSSQVSDYIRRRFPESKPARRPPSAWSRRTWEPLLLALACDTMTERSLDSHGDRESDLYDELLRAMLSTGWRKQPSAERRRRSRVAPAKIRALEAIACHMSSRASSTVPISEEIAAAILEDHPFESGRRFATSLDELVEGDGVLRRRGMSRPEIDFGHGMFQSYLTARSLASAGSAGVEQALGRAWFDPHWEDVVVFMAGLGALQLSDVISLSDGPDVFRTRLVLAARCAGQMTSGDVDFSSLAVRLLALLEDRYTDAMSALTSMGGAAYGSILQTFVARPSARLGQLLAEVATDDRAKRVLRVFVETSSNSSERLRAALAAASLGDTETLKHVLSMDTSESSFDPSSRHETWSAAGAITSGRWNDPSVEVLFEAYQRKPPGSFGRAVLARALGGIHSAVADTFAWEILSDKEEPAELRGEIAYDLFSRGERGSTLFYGASSGFTLFGTSLFEAISTLATGGTRAMDAAFRLMSASGDPLVATVGVMFTRDEHDESEAKAAHRALLWSADVEVRFDAIRDLHVDELELCVQALAVLAKHERDDVRRRAAEACREMPPASVESIVCELLTDPVDHVRRQAINTAGNLRLLAALPSLLEIERSFDPSSLPTDDDFFASQPSLYQVAMRAEGPDADLAFAAIAAIGDARYGPIATRRFHEGRASATQIAHFRDERLWPLILDQWISSIARATFDVSGMWHDHEIRAATWLAKDAARAFGIFRDPRAINVLLSSLPVISAQVREPLFYSLNTLMTSTNAVEISARLLDGIEQISAKDTKHVVLTSSNGRVMDGTRVMDYGVSYNFNDVRDIFRRAAPFVRQAYEDRNWFAWYRRCEAALRDPGA
jgi:hypothetical protein